MLHLDPSKLEILEVQHYMQAAVAPRPICFASTVDKEGNVNLSPFSFFNMVSSNPPICIFSPSRRVRDNTTKHTLENLLEVPECVINIVNYSMVHQASLASTDYPRGVNEFVKAGFTELPSSIVRPPRVAESPVQFECKVSQVIRLGEKPGSGNLVIAEVILIHVDEKVLDGSGRIDQAKLDLVARLSGDWYCRVSPDNLFKVARPNTKIGIGIDSLPPFILRSTVFTKKHLAQLANIEGFPTHEAIEEFRRGNKELQEEITNLKTAPTKYRDHFHKKAIRLLDQGLANEAWLLLLASK